MNRGTQEEEEENETDHVEGKAGGWSEQRPGGLPDVCAEPRVL